VTAHAAHADQALHRLERLRHLRELKTQEAGSAAVTPLQPKQQRAETLAGQADELLFGGAAGGGKTHWLISHAARQCEQHPGNRVVIFRRVFPSLARSVIPRARALLAGRARYNDARHVFEFPNGSVLELASLQYARTAEDYYGAEYGLIAFEELTEFLEAQVDYLLSRLRAPVAGVRPHMIATTNPGGVGHRWVKRRYVRPDPADVDGLLPQPGQVWRPRPTPDRPAPLTRCFLPATLEDNPALLHRDPGYRHRLRMIANRGLRRALEQGDWDAIDVVEGALWQPEWLDGGRVAAAPPAQRRVLAVDPSDGEEGGDAYGVSVCSLGQDRHGYVEHSAGWAMSPHQLAVATVQLYHDMRCDRVVVEKNHGGKWIPALIKTVDRSVPVSTVWASEGKRTRAEPIAALVEPDRDYPTGRCHIVGRQDQLEGELTSYTGLPGEVSPNLLDAMVWACTQLGLAPASGGVGYFGGMAAAQSQIWKPA
jgi:hypothetical protein